MSFPIYSRSACSIRMISLQLRLHGNNVAAAHGLISGHEVGIFPLVAANANRARGIPPNSHPSSEAFMKDSRPLKVLVVEDDAITAMDIEHIVRQFGGDPIARASSALDALGLAVEHLPDVVLMDIRLDGGPDGLGCAHAIRALLQTPIVFVTGNADPTTLQRIRDFGRSGLVLKPINEHDLCSAVVAACLPQ